MNTDYKLTSLRPSPIPNRLHRLHSACGHCYERVVRRLSAIRSGIEREFSWRMAGYEQLLKSAMNEAEALAWQTSYPHLFFPALAEEKAAAVQQWAVRQRTVRAKSPARVLSAVLGLAALMAVSTGCGRGQRSQPPPSPAVTVAPVEQKEVV